MRRQTRNIVLIWLGAWGLLMILAIGIPATLVSQFTTEDIRMPYQLEQSNALEPLDHGMVVPVYLTQQQKVETIPLDDYIRGVLAAEMPPEFELEALKAQAIAARTYIVRRMLLGDTSQVPVEGAIVTDSELHQAYVTEEQYRNQWSEQDYQEHMKKLNQAIIETKHLILTYQGEPIQAVFFSTSNGFTENSEDYWQNQIPYLRSVPSPWDAKLSPRYKQTTTIQLTELYRKLGLTLVQSAQHQWNILEKTDGHRIKTIAIGGKTFTGREVREKLGLPSSTFQWMIRDGVAIITTLGYGHGVGMSQWGANGMAKEGKTAEEILIYYYRGVSLLALEDLKSVNKIMHASAK